MEPTFGLAGTEHTFTPFGGPLDQPDDAQLLSDCGRAILAWSRLEYIVTALAIHINKKATSEIIYDPDPKTKLRDLLKLVRKWLVRHPEYAGLKSAVDDQFLDLLYKDIDLRNNLVHGFLESVDSRDGTFTVRALKRSGKDTWSALTMTYGVQIPAYLASQATLASRHFTEICKVVFDQGDHERG